LSHGRCAFATTAPLLTETSSAVVTVTTSPTTSKATPSVATTTTVQTTTPLSTAVETSVATTARLGTLGLTTSSALVVDTQARQGGEELGLPWHGWSVTVGALSVAVTLWVGLVGLTLLRACHRRRRRMAAMALRRQQQQQPTRRRHGRSTRQSRDERAIQNDRQREGETGVQTEQETVRSHRSRRLRRPRAAASLEDDDPTTPRTVEVVAPETEATERQAEHTTDGASSVERGRERRSRDGRRASRDGRRASALDEIEVEEEHEPQGPIAGQSGRATTSYSRMD